ncbi:MAG: hypothetical protein H7A40_07210 [Chlamydiales bacterium]|nr:hypothetical protein [Chlamydiales bacterium]
MISSCLNQASLSLCNNKVISATGISLLASVAVLIGYQTHREYRFFQDHEFASLNKSGISQDDYIADTSWKSLPRCIALSSGFSELGKHLGLYIFSSRIIRLALGILSLISHRCAKTSKTAKMKYENALYRAYLRGDQSISKASIYPRTISHDNSHRTVSDNPPIDAAKVKVKIEACSVMECYFGIYQEKKAPKIAIVISTANSSGRAWEPIDSQEEEISDFFPDMALSSEMTPQRDNSLKVIETGTFSLRRNEDGSFAYYNDANALKTKIMALNAIDLSKQANKNYKRPYSNTLNENGIELTLKKMMNALLQADGNEFLILTDLGCGPLQTNLKQIAELWKIAISQYLNTYPKASFRDNITLTIPVKNPEKDPTFQAIYKMFE